MEEELKKQNGIPEKEVYRQLMMYTIIFQHLVDGKLVIGVMEDVRIKCREFVTCSLCIKEGYV